MKRLAMMLCGLCVASCTSQPASESSPAQATASGSIAFSSKSPEAIAHLVKGESLRDNQRPDEALEEFSAALKLDPGFVIARLEHGVATPGPTGLTEIEEAATAAKPLPEAERLLADAALSARRGERGDAIRAMRRLTEVAPGYSRGQQLLGVFLIVEENLTDGTAALKEGDSIGRQ